MTQSSVLERELVDTTHNVPAAAAPAGAKKASRTARTWRNRAVVLLMVAGAAYGTLQIVDHQTASSYRLAVDDVVLTSQPIEITLAQAGLVTSVAVHGGDTVVAGQRVGSVDVTTTNSAGHAVIVPEDLHAPGNGVVVNDPLAVGNTLLPGNSFLTMYDPTASKLVTTVPLSSLPRIKPGMSADLTAPGVTGTVHAVIQRAVPNVGSEQTTVPKGSVQIVLTPQRQTTVATLLPGLRFAGYIDTRTATHSSDAEHVGTTK